MEVPNHHHLPPKRRSGKKQRIRLGATAVQGSKGRSGFVFLGNIREINSRETEVAVTDGLLKVREIFRIRLSVREKTLPVCDINN